MKLLLILPLALVLSMLGFFLYHMNDNRHLEETDFYSFVESRLNHLEKELAEIPDSLPHDKFHSLSELGGWQTYFGDYDKAIAAFNEARLLLPEIAKYEKFSASTTAEHARETYVDLSRAYFHKSQNESCADIGSSDYTLKDNSGSLRPSHSPEVLSNSINVLDDYLELNSSDNTVKYVRNYLIQVTSPQKFENSKMEDQIIFKNRAPQLGIDDYDLAGGAIIDDFTGDGLLDIITTSIDSEKNISFYVQKLDGSFDDLSLSSGLGEFGGGINVIHGDYNNDGFEDIYVMRGGWWGAAGRMVNSLYKNNGNSTFTDVTESSGLGLSRYPTVSAAFADYDLDGDLDLYVGNQVNFGVDAIVLQTHRHSFDPLQEIERYASELYKNNGNGTFTNVARFAGVENYSLTAGVTWGDVNKDDYPDLFVSNMGEKNKLFINQRNGTFKNEAEFYGVSLPLQSFSAWFWDYNHDGLKDLFVPVYVDRLEHYVENTTNLQREEHGFYRGTEEFKFQNVAVNAGLYGPESAMGANFGDVNNDGLDDIYLGNGFMTAFGVIPNSLYVQRQDHKFEEKGNAFRVDYLERGHSVAFGDVDNDGDVDIYHQLGGAAPGDRFCNVLLENQSPRTSWLTLKLIGTISNSSAFGAVVMLDIMQDGTVHTKYYTVGEKGSFGGNSHQLEIGLGVGSMIKQLRIYWPVTKKTQLFDSVEWNRIYKIIEGDDALYAT